MTEMDQIYKVHNNLYIGAYWPRLNFEKFKKIGITAIVNLMEDNLYNPTSQGFAYLHKGFPDDWYPPHDYLEEILLFIDEHIKTGKVLVHCSMGVSRSGGIIIAWLLKENPDWSWSDALNYIKKSRLIYPAIEIKESIIDYLESKEGYRRSY
jgi:protein-tyrosine phosphatase